MRYDLKAQYIINIYIKISYQMKGAHAVDNTIKNMNCKGL